MYRSLKKFGHFTIMSLYQGKENYHKVVTKYIIYSPISSSFFFWKMAFVHLKGSRIVASLQNEFANITNYVKFVVPTL